jgi:hypothetical protein
MFGLMTTPLHVNAEYRFPSTLERRVKTAMVLTNHREILWRFQRNGIGYGKRGRTDRIERIPDPEQSSS